MTDTTRRRRVLLVDDSEAIRGSLTLAINAHDRLRVVAVASDGVEGVEAARVHRPDVVVMDHRMPRMDGIDATRLIREHLPEARIVMLSAYDDMSIIAAAIEAGAHDFLCKGVSAARIHDALLSTAVHGIAA